MGHREIDIGDKESAMYVYMFIILNPARRADVTTLETTSLISDWSRVVTKHVYWPLIGQGQ